jgi:ATP-dependent Lhr-like helicase
MSAFSRFPARLQQAIVSRLGWTSLRPVQELAGEAILDGKNVVVLAPTAGGKTEASMFPALANLVERPVNGVGVIYIAPIKALLNNQEKRLGTYTEMVGLRRFVWHGDVGEGDKRAFVKEPAELLMTTPESLEAMLVSPRVPVESLFGDLRMIVVDEVHAVAGTDRGAHLMSVLERLRRYTANDIQRVGLSATVGNPEQILKWLQGTSAREGTVVDPPKVVVPREIQVCLQGSVFAIAQEAARRARGMKSLFFCQSRALTENTAERMRGQGTEVFVHHGSVSKEERHAAEAQFHHGTNACIVCTSTLELGIDVGDLDRVLQANAPSTVSSFLQRMGRTGRRAGQTANTTFLCEDEEALLQAVALVELARSRWVESGRVRLIRTPRRGQRDGNRPPGTGVRGDAVI